jgi:hypothetical protein
VSFLVEGGPSLITEKFINHNVMPSSILGMGIHKIPVINGLPRRNRKAKLDNYHTVSVMGF